MAMENEKNIFDIYYSIFSSVSESDIDRRQKILQEFYKRTCPLFSYDILYYDYLGTNFEHDIQLICQNQENQEDIRRSFVKNSFQQYQDLLAALDATWMEPTGYKESFFTARQLLFALPDDTKEEERRNCIEKYVDSYFSWLIDLLEFLNLHPDASEMKNFVDNLMIIDCIKDSFDNRIYMSRFHPLVLIIYCKGMDFLTYEEKLIGKLASIDSTYGKLFIDIARKNYSRFFNDKMVNGNRLYFYNPNLKEYQNGALPLMSMCAPQELDSLTPIKSLRIIEKIVNLPGYKHYREGDPAIKVAVFGSFQDEEDKAVVKYFKHHKDMGQNIPEIVIHHFERVSIQAEDFRFCHEEDSSRISYNLLDNASLERLFAEYQLVLLLDMGCFYSTRKSEKILNYEWVSSRIGLIRSFITKENSQQKSMEWYFSIYSIIQKWMFSYFENMNTQLEFNPRLFRAIDNAAKNETRVYAYISQGQKMADIDLADDNMCKYEFYNGRGLTVYRFETSNEDDYKLDAFLEEKKRKAIQVPLWKLVKSLNSEFCHNLWKILAEREIEIDEYDFIFYLRHTYLVINYEECLKNAIQGESKTEPERVIRFLVYPDKDIQTVPLINESTEVLNEITKVILKTAFEGQIPYISGYLREVCSMVFMSDAVSMDDFMFAYLLRNKMSLKVAEISQEDADEYNGIRINTDKLCYKKHKLLSKIIEELDRYRIARDDERNIVLFSDFIVRYARPLTDEDFYKVLCSIGKSCVAFSYINSELYQNTKGYLNN